jgi:hypothetical protein
LRAEFHRCAGGRRHDGGQWLLAVRRNFSFPDSTHIDINVGFVHPWVSGGRIGGSLDALPFSLDSISTAAVAQLAAVGPSRTLGFFTGDNIEAILETTEADAFGPMVFINDLWPMTDSPDALCSVGYRKRPMDAIVYTNEAAVTDYGSCPLTQEARYAKGRMRIPAGSRWTYARGIRPDVQPAGEA